MRTRFPPSPTGLLHVGALRTALYNYLIARKTGGSFAMRIEDTDQERSVPGAIEQFLHCLHWAGIDPDEGVMLRDGKIVEIGDKGPYIQSKRLDLYKKHAEELRKAGHAYPCFCTPERLEKMREEQQAKKLPPMYDRLCLRLPVDEIERRLAAGERHVLRLKIPQSGSVTFTDEIRGPLTFQWHTVDDQVLLKSDGFPTYHLAHVVDDHLMAMDLVLRGEEWLSSLPKHLLLFDCFKWTKPKYAHVPLLLNKDRSKLSKRQGSVSVNEYIEKGYLPEALCNFLALLGWNPGTTQELFSMEELIAAFSLDRVQKSGAIFDVEKLNWLQGQWMRKISIEEFVERTLPLVVAKYPQAKSDQEFQKKAQMIQQRITFFSEAPEMLSFFYEEPSVTMELIANEKQKVARDQVPDILRKLEEILTPIPEKNWTVEGLKSAVQNNLGNFKIGQLLWPLRAVLTGLAYSPGAFEVAEALGKVKSLQRLQKAKGIVGTS